MPSLNSLDVWRVIQAFSKSHPVRQEVSGERNLEFSEWIRKQCRPSKSGCFIGGTDLGCFVVSDLDFILWDYSRFMLQLIEVKTHGAQKTFPQMKLFPVLDKVIANGSRSANVTYLGLYTLRLENTTPSNSKWIMWDDKTTTKEECWRLINMINNLDNLIMLEAA